MVFSFVSEAIEVSGPRTLLSIVEAFQPDVVIEEIVERHLEMLLESVGRDWSTVKQVPCKKMTEFPCTADGIVRKFQQKVNRSVGSLQVLLDEKCISEEVI